MKSSDTPEKWLRKDEQKKLTFVHDYVGRRNAALLSYVQPLMDPSVLSQKLSNSQETLKLLNLYLTAPTKEGFQIKFNQIRSAWNGYKHRGKHQAELQSFYLTKETKKHIKSLADQLSKSQSEFLVELVSMAWENRASMLALHELQSEVKRLSAENYSLKNNRDNFVDQINNILLNTLSENCEYTVVKKELPTEVENILKNHAEEIRYLQKDSISTIRQAIKKYKETIKKQN